ncbi:hypothetical protein ROZALSC1DRAFT_25836 [Rozella allomycis CSF55]|uniref:SWIM-type domain-containing protein n=1 Tax=Rozella allomycis (strain CSF55) TaxID=988480 RepID=A0A4P9Y9S5_ROZAC|nr:hypothetical protein ROZALSC1DRAFT_25836 [Rozella allomycis CSF55]
MCFTHVLRNAEKHFFSNLPLSSSEKAKIWKSEILIIFQKLSKSRNEREWKRYYENLKEICKKQNYNAFWTYLSETWLNPNSFWSNWASYLIPPGYALTNNAIERFNATLKSHYTKRKRLTAVELMEKLESVVFDFGNDLNFSFKKEFLLYRNYDQDVVKKAISNIRNYIFDKTIRSQKTKLINKRKKSICFIIDLEKGSCDCRNWLYWRTCYHVLIALALKNLNPPLNYIPDIRGLIPRGREKEPEIDSDENGAPKRKRGRPSKVGAALSYI